MNDDELEQQVRAGLQRRADRARVDDALVARASGASGRRRRRWVAVGAAAAVVLAVAGIAVAQRDDGPARTETAADRTTERTTGQGGWRTESWRDVQVEVPDSWGYGSAPVGAVGGEAVTCYPAAAVDAAGLDVGVEEQSTTPYVGRPIGYTDVCVPYPDNRPDAPATDYVWLGGAVTPGVVELGNGLVQETVAVDGSTVTVATADPRLRERILGTVTGGEQCLAEVERSGPVAHDAARDLDAPAVTLRVCAYQLDEAADGPWRLTYAADLGRDAARAYTDAVAAGAPEEDQCPTIDYQLYDAVVLELLDSDGGVLRQDSVNPSASCAGIAVDARQVWELETVALTPETTRPWLVGGLRAVVRGDAAFGFIGPQG